MVLANFEWNLQKESENLEKHGISFEEAAATFQDPDGFQIVDLKHSAAEARFYWIGKLADGRVLTTRFTQRGERIRIFGSAEWRKFKRLYERTVVKKHSNR